MQRALGDKQVAAVLQILWRRSKAALRDIVLESGLSEPDVREIIEILSQRGCLIESQLEQVELVRAGIGCWRDILEGRSAAMNKTLGRRALVFRATASTNDVCFKAMEDVDAHGLVVLADEQLAGRGRRGHSWVANAGQSVLVSILLTQGALNAEMLTLLVGLACAEAVERSIGRQAELKWPNDVLIDGKKIAGVLVEKRGGGIVLGIGMNVAQSQSDFPEPLRNNSTSIYLVSGTQMDRLRIVIDLLDRIEDRCLNQSLSDNHTWLDAWKRRCPMLGQYVNVRAGEGNLSGHILDVDPSGGLLLRDNFGATHLLSAQTATILAR